MRHLSISSVAATVLGALVLASLLLFSGNNNSAEAAYGAADPVAGSVANVAIDMDITGNAGARVPSVETSVDSLAVGSTVLIDIVVDEVHPADGYQGASFNLLYDPAVVEVTSKAHGAFSYAAAPLFVFSEGLPDTDGNWRYDEGALGATTIGEKAIVRLGIKCIAAGQSFLDLADTIGGDGIPDIFVPPAGAPIGAVLTSSDAQIGCGTGDPDFDGFVTGDVNSGETFIGTDPNDACADTATRYDERGPAFGEPLSPWPPDINDDGKATLSDVLAFSPAFNKTKPDPAYSPRFDLNTDDRVTLADVLSISPYFNKFC